MSAIDDDIGNPFSKELGCIDDEEEIFLKKEK
jgi:hypothetical protein